VEKMPDDIVALIQNNPVKNTAYTQAKEYFHIDESPYLDQACLANLCDKTWYAAIETGDEEINDDITVYTTQIPGSGSDG
jgi:hypothetical protein